MQHKSNYNLWYVYASTAHLAKYLLQWSPKFDGKLYTAFNLNNRVTSVLLQQFTSFVAKFRHVVNMSFALFFKYHFICYKL